MKKNSEKEINLIKEVCEKSITGFRKDKTVLTISPEDVFEKINTDIIDIRNILLEQRKFEKINCQKIGSASTKDSCIIIGLIIQLLKPKISYEIGRYHGYSTAQIAYNMREAFNGESFKIVSIDPHDGANPGAGWESDKFKQAGNIAEWDISKNNLKSAGVYELVECIKDYSQKYIEYVNDDIEFLFIDGDHTYLGAKLDLENYGNKMIKGGICVIHDVWGHEYRGINCGPTQVFDEADKNKWEKIGFTWDVGILRKI